MSGEGRQLAGFVWFMYGGTHDGALGRGTVRLRARVEFSIALLNCWMVRFCDAGNCCGGAATVKL